MAANEHLVQAMAARLTKQFSETETIKHNDYFDRKTTTLPCRNTRTVTVNMLIPMESNDMGKIHYGYEFAGHSGVNDQYDLNGIAEEMLKIGYANDDISGHAPGDLAMMGFIPETGTNLCAISNMLRPNNYRLVMTDDTSYGPEYSSGHEGEPYYGPVYRDIFVTENLTIFGKTIAHRLVKIGTKTVNAYVGD